MRNEFTPGPWNIEQPYGESGVYVAGPNTGLICKLYPPDNQTFNVDKLVTEKGNARLIATAPELLEALESIARGLTNGQKERGETVQSIALAAIAKATKGEQ